MTPSRTIQGWENQRAQPIPIHHSDFNPFEYRITEIRLKRGYSRYTLPSWHHFDRVVNLGNNTVAGITGKLQTILKVEKINGRVN